MVTCPKSETEAKVTSRECNKALKIWSRLTRSSKTSSYSRMKDGSLEPKKKSKGLEKNLERGKENKVPIVGSDKKPKRKGWKKIRHAALVTCRYIGAGVSYMGVGATYPTPDYPVDPKTWNKTFSPGYNKSKLQQPPQTSQWTTANVLFFSGW